MCWAGWGGSENWKSAERKMGSDRDRKTATVSSSETEMEKETGSQSSVKDFPRAARSKALACLFAN